MVVEQRDEVLRAVEVEHDYFGLKVSHYEVVEAVDDDREELDVVVADEQRDEVLHRIFSSHLVLYVVIALQEHVVNRGDCV